jgi:hypothetical protein
MCSISGTWAKWFSTFFDNDKSKKPSNSDQNEKGPIELTTLSMKDQDRDLLSAIYKRVAESAMKQKNYKEVIANYKKLAEINQAVESENPEILIISYK